MTFPNSPEITDEQRYCKCGHSKFKHKSAPIGSSYDHKDWCLDGWSPSSDNPGCLCNGYEHDHVDMGHGVVLENNPVSAPGRKDDAGKPRMSLLNPDTWWALVEVMEIGAQQYGDLNYRKVENWETRYKDALERHLEDARKGVTADRKTGKHPAIHALANAFMLADMYLIKSIDNAAKVKHGA